LRILVWERGQLERYNPRDFYSKFYFFITDDDPRNVREAMYSEDIKLWKNSMVEETKTLDKNEAWDLEELSTGRKSIGSK
jgi:hypothetical protein